MFNYCLQNLLEILFVLGDLVSFASVDKSEEYFATSTFSSASINDSESFIKIKLTIYNIFSILIKFNVRKNLLILLESIRAL